LTGPRVRAGRVGVLAARLVLGCWVVATGAVPVALVLVGPARPFVAALVLSASGAVLWCALASAGFRRVAGLSRGVPFGVALLCSAASVACAAGLVTTALWSRSAWAGGLFLGVCVAVLLLTAGVDERLDERGFIAPGLGDAGDRLYGVV